MSYRPAELRRGMDVFSADDVYVGSVIWVRTIASTGRGPSPPASVPPPAAPDGRQSSTGTSLRPAFSGESLGPMPTAGIGNGGPMQQTHATAYASHRADDGAQPGRHVTELVVLRLFVALNWATLRPRLSHIPVALVQAASLERIILAVNEADLH